MNVDTELWLCYRFLYGSYHCMALTGLVLYLYIYIAQCERPREKKAVLREREDALGTPVNKVDRVEGRSWCKNWTSRGGDTLEGSLDGADPATYGIGVVPRRIC